MLIQVTGNLRDQLLDREPTGLQNDLSTVRLLVADMNASKVLYLASPGQFVQAFDVAFLAHAEWRLNKRLYELDAGLFVRFSDTPAILE